MSAWLHSITPKKIAFLIVTAWEMQISLTGMTLPQFPSCLQKYWCKGESLIINQITWLSKTQSAISICLLAGKMVMLKGFNHCQYVSQQLPSLTLTWKIYGRIFCFNIWGTHRGEDSYYGVACDDTVLQSGKYQHFGGTFYHHLQH